MRSVTQAALLLVRLSAFVTAVTLLAACEQAGNLIPDDETVVPTEAPTAVDPITITPTVVTVGPGTAEPTPEVPDLELSRSVVQVHLVADRPVVRTVADGSGVVVDAARGLILTAYSLVHPYSPTGERAYSTINIAVNDGNGGSPRFAFEADLVAADVETDLAILRIARQYGGDPLTRGRALPREAQLGDSSALNIGNRLRLFAHPGIDGSDRSQILTVTLGTITGVRGQVGQADDSRLRLDARLSYGATGGPAFALDGSLVGILVPEHYDVAAPVTLLRPIAPATALINAARRSAPGTSLLPPLFAIEPPAGFDMPTPDDRSWVSAPAFALNSVNNNGRVNLEDYRRHFPEGTPTLYFEFSAYGLGLGPMVEERWFHDDAWQDQLSSSYAWIGTGLAVVSDHILAPSASGLPDGRWRLEIWVDGLLRARSAAVIGTRPVESLITNISFGSRAHPNGQVFTPPEVGSSQLLMFFEYSGMESARQISWTVVRNGNLIYRSGSVAWPGGSSGRYWIGYPTSSPLAPGSWTIELFVDGISRASEATLVR